MPLYRFLAIGDVVVYEGLEYEVVDVNGSRVTLSGRSAFSRRSVLAWQLMDDIELIGRVPVVNPPQLTLADAGITGRDARDAEAWHDVVLLLERGRDWRALPDDQPDPNFDPALPKSVRVQNAVNRLKERGIIATARTVYNMCERWAADPSVLSFVDGRKLRRARINGDEHPMLAKLRVVLEEHRGRPDVSDKHLLAEARDLVTAETPGSTFPHRSTQSKYLAAVKVEKHWQDSARQRRSASKRPDDGYNVIRASRPGEFVHADSTKMACELINEKGQRQRYELSILIDVFSTAVLAFALAPTTTASTIVRLLARASFPRGVRPFAPAVGDLVDDEISDNLASFRPFQDWDPDDDPAPFVAIETLVIDNGKPFIAELTIRVAEQLGCGIRYARTYSPEDKGKVEKALKDIETRLMQLLPGFTGSSVEHRGTTPDSELLPHVVMVQLLSDWFDDVWANTTSRGLTDPFSRGAGSYLTPNQVLITATAIAPSIPIPDVAENYVHHLESSFRTIQHYGIDHANMVFDAPELSPLYGQPSGDNRHDDKFLVKWDPDYPTVLWVYDPFKKGWIVCPWKRVHDYERPFAREMLRGASTHTEGVVQDETRATKRLVASYDRYRSPAVKRSKRQVESQNKARRSRRADVERMRGARAPMTDGAEEVRLMGQDEEIG